MAGGIDWFRWYHTTTTDPKFQLVARKAGTALPAVIAVWAHALEKASESEERGVVGNLDAEAVDCLFGLDEGTTQRILDAMRDRNLIDADGRVVAWSRRQPKREREDSTAAERKRRQRNRDAHENEASGHADGGHDTPLPAASRHVTPCHARERLEESREDIEEPPKPPASGGRRTSAMTFSTFMARCRDSGEKAISDYAPVLRYADEARIPMEFVSLCWTEFKRRHSPGGGSDAKRYTDWRRAFLNAVQSNWYGLWSTKSEGAYELTSKGLQARTVHAAREATDNRDAEAV